MTPWVALIGSPLRRRHSEVMHNAAFRRFGIDAHYELRELTPAEVPAFVTEARSPDCLGFQVTAPYKQVVVPMLDRIEADAAAIGAVNSVVRENDGTLVGFNTDADGFATAVRTELGVDLKRARVAVAGAGGAARAVVRACLTRQAQVVVGARQRAKAQALVADLAGPGMHLEATELGDAAFNAGLERATLAVNATTVGMLTAGTPFDVTLLPATSAVLDLVYVPYHTELRTAAQRRGLPASGGGGMLVAQAAAAFERWTGVPDAAPIMAEAVAPLLHDPEAAP